jgi:hypothetical protein
MVDLLLLLVALVVLAFEVLEFLILPPVVPRSDDLVLAGRNAAPDRRGDRLLSPLRRACFSPFISKATKVGMVEVFIVASFVLLGGCIDDGDDFFEGICCIVGTFMARRRQPVSLDWS